MKITVAYMTVILLLMGLVTVSWADDKKEETATSVADAMAMMSKMQSHKSVEAVNWDELSKFIPEKIEGMEAGELDGGTINMSSPTNPNEKMSHSTAERKFTQTTKDKDSKTIKFTIMDSGFNQMIMAPFAMHMEYDSPDGYMKWTEVNDRKAALIVDKNKGAIDGIHVFTIVSDRLIVMVEGNEFTTVDEIKDNAKLIDYDGLAKLIKAQPEEEEESEE